MKIKELIKIIQDFAPFEIAYDWDNSGLICGDENADISGICVCLDLSLEAINTAIKNNCNTILSHHPFIFKKLNRIDYNSYFGKMLTLIIKNNISVISAHTNIDKAEFGINYKLAKMLDLENINILEKDNFSDKVGLGRTGFLNSETSFGDFCDKVSKTLKTPIRAIGDKDAVIKKIAIGSGSCIELTELAVQQGCDVFVTGDVKYHEGMDSGRDKLFVIDAGHYGTEICVLDIFEELLNNKGINLVKEYNSDIFSYMG